MAARGRKKPLDRISKLKRFVWCWGLTIALAGVLSFLASIYVNFTEFRDSAFGARDERSLLLPSPGAVANPKGVSLGPVVSLGFMPPTPTASKVPPVQNTATVNPSVTSTRVSV